MLGPVSTWVKGLGELWKKYREPFLDMAKEKNMVAYRYWDERKQPVYCENNDLPGIVYSIPGKEAFYAVVSYAKNDLEEKVNIIPDILGFKKYKVIDIDTNEEVPVEKNSFLLKIKKHDLKVFRILNIE